MKPFKSKYLAGIIVLSILCGTGIAHAQKKDKKNNNNNNNNGNNQTQPQRGAPGANGGPQGGPGQGNPPNRPRRPTGVEPTVDKKPNAGGGDQGTGRKVVDKTPKAALTTHETKDGGYEKTASSGRVQERMEKKDDGQHVTQFSPAGTKQREEINRPDGSKQVNHYDLGGKHVRQEEVSRPDGSREVSNHQYGRSGEDHARETVKYDSNNRIVSRTTIKIVNKTTITTRYDYGRFGYVYHPAVFVVNPFWVDPYWFTPAGVVVVHPFHYDWGWDGGWYHSYGPYFTAYPVYPAPSYWVTDWMVAGYLQDHYEASMSAEQARQEAALAREEADKARRTAEQAQDQAEIAEAKAAQAEAELHAKNAEAKATRLESFEAQAGKTNPSATPIDKDTKDQLRTQIEQNIAEKKELAGQPNPTLPDVTKALTDPKHVYPVSKTISVTTPDSEPAGNLSEGDLLKIKPGQEEQLKNPTPQTMVNMLVVTSKGEDSDEAKAGTTVSISIKDLQDFDSEFRAKLDVGLEEAAKNKDAFKQAADKS